MRHTLYITTWLVIVALHATVIAMAFENSPPALVGGAAVAVFWLFEQLAPGTAAAVVPLTTFAAVATASIKVEGFDIMPLALIVIGAIVFVVPVWLYILLLQANAAAALGLKVTDNRVFWVARFAFDAIYLFSSPHVFGPTGPARDEGEKDTAARGTPGADATSSDAFIALERYVRISGLTADEVRARLDDGTLQGRELGGTWYIQVR
ncbi:MAG: hypothetical protein AB7Q81_14145 [Gammaproteobacteria bacterium]